MPLKSATFGSAMTAHPMAGDKERCLEAGMDGYVSKPLRVEDLFSTIEEVLATPASIQQTLGAPLILRTTVPMAGEVSKLIRLRE
jgi:DNA-binding NarL/FixJ family response regulator